MKKIEVNPLDNMPWPRFILALKRMKERISSGLESKLEDSNDWGDKYTRATWGMCSEDKEQWPDAEDHIWPYDFQKHGRVAPLHNQYYQYCPFDRDRYKEVKEHDYPGSTSGCFYRCMLFRPKANDSKLWDGSSEGAVNLYSKAIEEAESRQQ